METVTNVQIARGAAVKVVTAAQQAAGARRPVEAEWTDAIAAALLAGRALTLADVFQLKPAPRVRTSAPPVLAATAPPDVETRRRWPSWASTRVFGR